MIFGSEVLEVLGQRRQRLVSRGKGVLELRVRLVFGSADLEVPELFGRRIRDSRRRTFRLDGQKTLERRAL